MRIFITILLSIEYLLIFFRLGQNRNLILSDQNVTTGLIIILFIFNAIIGLCYLLIKSNKKTSDYITITMLFTIIFFIPINNLIIENKKQNYRQQKKALEEELLGDTLKPFYEDKGTLDERRIQNLRENFAKGYATNGGKFYYGSANYDKPICHKFKHSFVTDDQMYIILSCQNPDNSILSYALATQKGNSSFVNPWNGGRLDHYEDYLVSEYPYINLLDDNDYTIIYKDPVDGTRYGKYYDQLYVLPMLDKNENELKSHISDRIIEFQKQHTHQFPNDKVIKLAYYLLGSNQCQSVDDVSLFGDDNLIMKCNQKSFTVNYGKLYQSVPVPSLMIPLEVLSDNHDQQDCLICACSKTGQVQLEEAPDFDASALKERIAEQCQHDNQWPYNKCVGIYYESLLKTDFGNYLRASIVHVKEGTKVAQCIVEVSEKKFTEIQTGLKTNGNLRKAN